MNYPDTNGTHARTIVIAASSADSRAQAKPLAIAAAAFAIGMTLVAIAGFAETAAVHDAAHDTRHSLAFPCH